MNEIQTIQMRYNQDFSTYKEAKEKANEFYSSSLYIRNISIQRKTYGMWKLEITTYNPLWITKFDAIEKKER